MSAAHSAHFRAVTRASGARSRKGWPMGVMENCDDDSWSHPAIAHGAASAEGKGAAETAAE
eukprot:scaffold292755_cov33-Tisochrysis_lutea.AAC.1